MNLWSSFISNNGDLIFKWTHYFPVYEQLFNRYRNKSIVFLEIGVYKGGSLKMWQRFFGPNAKIIGIDIDPECKQYESPGIFVRIGDQSDQKFLASVVEEFGPPDIVLDDGSHKVHDVMNSFLFLYPLMPKDSIYVVEDLHCAYWHEWGGGLYNPNSFIEFTKDCIDKLHADYTRGLIEPDLITRTTLSITIFDSIVCFHKSEVWWKESTKSGQNYRPFVDDTYRVLYEPGKKDGKNGISLSHREYSTKVQLQLDYLTQQLQVTQQELDATKAQLAESTQQLQVTQQELDATKAQLAESTQQLQVTQQELDATKAQLAESTQQLQVTQQELDATKAQLAESTQQLHATQQELDATKMQLQVTQQELRIADEQLQATKHELDIVKAELVWFKQEVERIHNSCFWKVWQMLRRVKKLVTGPFKPKTHAGQK